MNRFEVHCGTASVSRAGRVVGAVWCAFGGEPFPARGWYDFSATVLTQWLSNLRLAPKPGDQVVLPFFDGLFFLGCTGVDNRHVLLEGFENDNSVTAQEKLDFEEAINAILKAAISLLSQRSADLAASRDWKTLEKAINGPRFQPRRNSR
jgi:hypothetical protein